MTWIYRLGIIFLAAVIIGALYQKGSTLRDQYRFRPLGQLIDIGGYKLHVHSTGEGNPTVVLDAGMGGTSLGWASVQPEIAKFTRVCSFDRAGYGWSEEAASKRTSLHIAEELHTLLHKANIPGPYILVGHSFGGCNALLFANLYTEETAGVVLVDSVHEDMSERLPSPANQGILKKILAAPKFQWFQSVVGCKRIRGASPEIKTMMNPLPESAGLQYQAHMNKTSYTNTVLKELECIHESLSQLKKANIQLYDKPLTVITAGKFSSSDERRIWNDLQKDLLLKSNQSKRVIAENSDHMINHHQPQIIVDAVREMIKEILND